MQLDDEILMNQYAQDIVSSNVLVVRFTSLNTDQKREAINDLIHLIMQSKPINEDVNIAITKSGLKSSLTPCVLLQKAVSNHNLYRMAELPENELSKVFILFINLFSIAYKRRYEKEKGDPNKWWYWNLSSPDVIEKIKSNFRS